MTLIGSEQTTSSLVVMIRKRIEKLTFFEYNEKEMRSTNRDLSGYLSASKIEKQF